MKAITIARKPVVGTVTNNVLTYGSGGLNIDASRIESDGSHMVSGVVARGSDTLMADRSEIGDGPGMFASGSTFTPTNHTGGRWPANLIFQHLDGCRCDGVKKVSGGTAVRHRGVSNQIAYGGNIGRLPKGTPDLGYVDADGKETVPNWLCEPSCPVRALDEQSGISKSSGGRTANISTTSTIYGGGKGLGQDLDPDSVKGDPGFGDVGGASRFFKQVKK